MEEWAGKYACSEKLHELNLFNFLNRMLNVDFVTNLRTNMEQSQYIYRIMYITKNLFTGSCSQANLETSSSCVGFWGWSVWFCFFLFKEEKEVHPIKTRRYCERDSITERVTNLQNSLVFFVLNVKHWTTSNRFCNQLVQLT